MSNPNRNLKKHSAGTAKAREDIVAVEALIRVSKVGERSGDSFISPELQREMIQRYCDERGWIIRAWHNETDVSGSTTDRVGLKAAMDACIGGRSQAIVVAKVDRFSRNLTEGLVAIKSLTAAGKSFVAIKDGIDGDTANRMGNMMLMLLLMFAEWQLETLTDGWLATREKQITNGVATVAPYGYKRDPDTRKLVIVDDQAKWVRHVFKERAAGKSWTVIADDLTDRNVPTAKGGARWTHNQIYNVVANRSYLGELRSGDEFVNTAAHEAIVTPEQFAAAHKITHTPKPKSGKPVSILAGLVRCGSCGGRMTKTWTELGGVRYERYRCRTRFSWGRCENPVEAPAPELEQIVLDRFGAMHVDMGVKQHSTVEHVDTAAAEAEVIDARWDLDQFTISKEVKRMARRNGYEWFENGLKDRQDTLDQAKAVLAELTARGGTFRMTVDERSMWDAMDDETRREMYSAGLACVVVWPGLERRIPGPLADRVEIFGVDERNAPTNLPGKGVKDSAITPIKRVKRRR